jgi:hypothetical protein
MEQLLLGLDVIVECVNPIALTRNAWLDVAKTAAAAIVEVEVVCSDEAEHRRRVATRTSDVEGLVKPTWSTVRDRTYEPWSRKHVVLDSTEISAEEAAQLIMSRMISARAATC